MFCQWIHYTLLLFIDAKLDELFVPESSLSPLSVDGNDLIEMVLLTLYILYCVTMVAIAQ